jgi:hypothetical protein
MCLEDVRLGRETQSVGRTVSVATTNTLLAPYAADRVALVIGGPVTNFCKLNFGAAASATAGIHRAAGAAPLILDVQKHGSLVFGPIYSIADTAAEVIGVWESFLGRQ